MNRINYDVEFEKVIKSLNGKKPKLLLHSCCAPCSSACLERLNDFFNITVYYYNPNIDTKEEFELRADEQVRYSSKLGIETIVVPYRPDEFYGAVTGKELEREGGARCLVCYNLRLSSTAEYAKEHGFDYFATTLTVSPLKNANALNEIGLELAKKTGVNYLPSDFKKKNGYLRSIELSKENGLYRQNYCGCKFSKPSVNID